MSDSGNQKPVAAGGQIPIPRATRGGVKGFIRDVRKELSRVDWPKPKETNRLTGVVLAVCAITAFIIFIMQFAAEQLLRIIQGKF